MLARVAKLRSAESQALHAFAALRLSNTALTLATPGLCLLAMLTARAAAGREHLSLASTFTALALVGTLQAPLSGVSEGLASAAQVKSSYFYYTSTAFFVVVDSFLVSPSSSFFFLHSFILYSSSHSLSLHFLFFLLSSPS